MSKTSKFLLAGLAIFILFGSNIATYIVTSAKYIERVEMLEKDNIRLTDDIWVLKFKLQAENLDD